MPSRTSASSRIPDRLARRADDARQIVDEAPAFSLTGTQASDLYTLVDRDPPDEPPTDPGLAHLATRALAAARRAPDRDRALRAYRRAIELDPFCAAAGDALSALEGEDVSA